MTTYDDIPETALAWHIAGQGAVLATVVETWGSAPRQAGAQLAISGEGALAGSVSGGCVEGAVVAEAMEALEDGRSRLLTYGVSNDEAFAVGLACGGTIRILVEPVGTALSVDMLEALCADRAARRSVGYLVNCQSWDRALVEDTPDGPYRDRFVSDRSGFVDDDRFLAVHNAPLRMIVVGAVHIAQSLVEMARLAGYDVTLVDPREAFASEARFPGTKISHDWPDEVLAELVPDRRTAVVTLTHDPKIDDPAIIAALGSEAFYLGSLGSKRTHAKRVDRLKAAGFDDAQISKIHAPVGLDIGAKSPAEIAISVMAEVTERLRRGERP